jgi:Zn-dependent protease
MLSNFSLTHLIQFILLILPLILAVTLHEVAHGYAALKMGDHTARLAGRLTLNPIKHLDLFGSFLLPLVLKLSGSPFIFGYAKPVPVNYHNFRDFRKGTLWVSSAGVLANAILAVTSAALFRMLAATIEPGEQSWIGLLLFYSVIINCILALFNLIPIPPLDGSRILAMLLPAPLRVHFARLERFGMIIILVLLITGPLSWLMSFFLNPVIDFLRGT